MSFISKIFYGVDLDEEQQRADNLDRELARLNAQRLADQKYSQEQFEQAEAHRIASQTNDINGDVRGAFREGLDDGAKNIRDYLSAPLDILPALPKIIPWQVWLAVIVYVAWRLGAFKGLSKRFA